MARITHALARLFRAVFGRESLPPAPDAAPRPARRSAVRMLLAPEELPEDPPLPPRRRGRWLAWLFAPERLDD